MNNHKIPFAGWLLMYLAHRPEASWVGTGFRFGIKILRTFWNLTQFAFSFLVLLSVLPHTLYSYFDALSILIHSHYFQFF